MNIENDEKNFLDEYGKHLLDMQNDDLSACPPKDQLLDYHNAGIKEKNMQDIEEHINICPSCLNIIERLNLSEADEDVTPASWTKIEKKLNEKFYNFLEQNPASPPKVSLFKISKNNLINFKNYFTLPSLIYAGGFTIIFLVSLQSFALFNQSDFYDLAEVLPDKQEVMRSENATESIFNKGIEAFNDKNYEQAINLFKKHSEQNSLNYSSHYMTGLSYLADAKDGFLIFNYKYDISKVKSGIEYLQKAFELSGENQYYQEDCYWYLGKAYLMLENDEQAKVYFEKMLQLDNPYLARKADAKGMIMELE